jgi:hypothetical protein
MQHIEGPSPVFMQEVEQDLMYPKAFRGWALIASQAIRRLNVVVRAADDWRKDSDAVALAREGRR